MEVTGLNYGRVLMTGGTNGVAVYDSHMDTIEEAGAISNSSHGHSLTVLDSGCVLILGGHNGISNVSAIRLWTGR